MYRVYYPTFHFVKYGPGAGRPNRFGARTFQRARRAKYPRRPRRGTSEHAWRTISLRNDHMFRPRHRMPSPHPLPQCAQPPLRTRLPFRTRPPFHAPSPLRARRRRPGAAARTCSRTPPRSAAPPQDEISLRNNLFRRLYRILLETRRVARRVRQSRPSSRRDAFGRDEFRRTAWGTHRRPAPRAARVLRASTRRVPTRRCPRTKATTPPPLIFSPSLPHAAEALRRAQVDDEAEVVHRVRIEVAVAGGRSEGRERPAP